MVHNFIPELWSALLLGFLKKNLVFGSELVTNRNYEGEISKQGDRVHIVEINDPTISNYIRGVTELSYENVQDAGLILSIDQSKSFAVRVDDCDAAQGRADLIGPITERASYGVKDVMDQFIAATLAAEPGIVTGLGTDATPLEINSLSALDLLLLIARRLDDGKVPRSGRWCAVPPFVIQDLVSAHAILSTDNVETLKEGFVGRLAGFDLLMSHNCPNTTGTKFKVLAGIPWAATFAVQLSKVEGVRLQASFADGLRGLFLYGARVVHPEALAMATCNEASES